MAQDRTLAAMTSRSLRTIKAELDFLAETAQITPTQHSQILTQLPSEPSTLHQPTPTPAVHNLSLDEKHDNGWYAPISPQPQPIHQQPPPSYSNPPPPPGPNPLTHATALYAYNPADAGDLALAPGDRVAVLEFMNADWWKGRSERTGQEGIFPRAYVREDGHLPAPPNHQSQNPYVAPQAGFGTAGKQPDSNPASYGSMPVDVAQQQNAQKIPSKGEEQAKKFGKKLGNAAIFGAGATIGSNIVNSIF